MMPQFANPSYLWLALVVPPLFWWWLRRRRNALRHPVVGLLNGLPVGRARFVRRTAGVLRSLALVLLVVALAGPRWPDLHTRIDTEGIALVMLVDVSGSMAERDFDWQGQPVSRLEAVKKVFRLFVSGGAGPAEVAGQPGAPPGPSATPDGSDPSGFQGRPTDQIGLVTFATRPETPCPLTLSHSVLLRLLDAEEPRSVPGESETNISDAIALGLQRLHAAGPRRKVLVLLSDGEHNVPQPRSGWTPRQAAQVAAGLHIPIYTIDAGGPGTGAETAAREAEAVERTASPGETRAQAVRTLRELAHITHGRSYEGHDTRGLLDACRAIDAVERTDIQSFQYRRYHEGYPWFALASFVLLAAALGLEQTLWRRIP
jgi:Ca-activated chloride channel family protein